MSILSKLDNNSPTAEPLLLSDKLFAYLVIGFAFILPFSKAAISLFHGLIVIFFIVKLFIERDCIRWNELKESRILIALSLFISLSLISILWSSNKIFALEYMGKYWHFLTIPIIYLCLKHKYISSVITSFLLGIFVTEVLTILIYFEFVHFHGIPPGIRIPPNDPSPFMNHANLSLYLAFTSIIILNRISYSETTHVKSIYSLFLISTVYTLIICGGRTGQVIFVISILLYTFLNIHHKIKAVLVTLCVLFTIFIFSYQLIPEFKQRADYTYIDVTSTLSGENYRHSFGQRVAMWKIGANIFMDNFFLGTGIGDETQNISKYIEYNYADRLKNVSDYDYLDFHSIFIQAPVQMGFLGLIVLIYLFYSMFTIKLYSFAHQNLNYIFVISVLMFGMTNNLLHTLFSMTFFAFFVSIFMVYSKNKSKTSEY